MVPRTELARGENTSVYAFHLPPGVEWTSEESFIEARRQGLTFSWLRTGHGVPWPGKTWASADVRRDPAPGDSIAVLVGSSGLGVQHQRGVTGLAWSYRAREGGDGSDFDVTVMSARPARASVEVPVSERAAVGLG